MRFPVSVIRTAALLALAVALVAAKAGVRAQQPAPRGSGDAIAVEVQVVDRDGKPVSGLAPDKFNVTIDGRKRRVVSAELMRWGTASPAPAEGRAIMLAIDCASFDSDVSRAVIRAATAL